MPTLINQHKKTNPWPYAVIATFLLFAGYIGFMVKQAMSSSVDLVSKDYYQKEIAYQQHMNTLSRTAQLTEAVSIGFEAANQEITVVLPVEFSGKQVQGTVQFFRPSDLSLDFQVPLLLDEQLQQKLSTAKLQKGFWKVRLSFTSNGQEFYKEQQLIIK